jgi:hypothetical protein
MAPRSENDRPIVVWAGRVGALFGYGAATRTYLEALRSAEIGLIVFDTISGKRTSALVIDRRSPSAIDPLDHKAIQATLDPNARDRSRRWYRRRPWRCRP